jgi:DnaJ-class molecular chaperone
VPRHIEVSSRRRGRDLFAAVAMHHGLENVMTSQKGPNIKKKQKCKNCEGKGLLKKGDKVVKCQRCGGTGVR